MPASPSTQTCCRFKPPDLTPDQWAAKEADAAREAERQREMIRNLRLGNSRIPVGFRMARTDDARVRAWAADPTVGLLLQGKPGRGKTHAACAALLELADSRSVEFATLQGVLEELKGTFGKRGESERTVMLRILGVGVLAIDDLGAERLTEWSLPLLFEIIDSRWANGRPTIVTTNLDGRELLAWAGAVDAKRGEALMSRLATYDRIAMEGADRRLR